MLTPLQLPKSETSEFAFGGHPSPMDTHNLNSVPWRHGPFFCWLKTHKTAELGPQLYLSSTQFLWNWDGFQSIQDWLSEWHSALVWVMYAGLFSVLRAWIWSSLYIIGNSRCLVLASKGHSVPATIHCATWHNLRPRIWEVEGEIINPSGLCFMVSDVGEAWIEATVQL